MKQLLLSLAFTLFSSIIYAQIGIGTTSPDPSSILDIQSTTKGILAPRINLNNVSNSTIDGTNTNAAGLLVYNTNASVTGGSGVGYYYWDGSVWTAMKAASSGGSGDGWQLDGNNIANGDFLGTTNYQALNFKVNNTQIGRLHPGGGVGFGFGSVATANNSFAIGNSATAQQDAVAIGRNANAVGNQSLALGYDSEANQDAVAVGYNADADGNESIAIGKNSKSIHQGVAIGLGAINTGNQSVALGYGASSSFQSTAFGYNALTNGNNAIAIGNSSSASSQDAISIGSSAGSSGNQSIAIGFGANGANLRSTAIGNSAKATANEAIAMGNLSAASSDDAIAIGRQAKSSASNTTAVGQGASATALNSSAFGTGATASASGATAIGKGAIASQQKTVILGASDNNVGIGTSTPQQKLHVNNGSIRINDGTEGAGKVLTSDANGNASWQAPAAVTPGDVKHGFQSVDHNGWYLLNGRAISSLPANAQTAAASLGFTGNLPNATNRVLKARTGSETLGATTGSNSIILTQANLPNYNMTATTSTNGNHSHEYQDGGANDINVGVYGLFSSNTTLADNGDVTSTTASAGSHSHTVTVNSGGSGTAINSTPASIVTNVFVYLGL